MRLCVLSSCCIKFNIFRTHQKSKQCHWQLDQPASASASAARCSQATSLESSLLVDPRDGRSGSSDQVVAAVLGRWSWGIRCLFGSVSTCIDPRRPTRRCEERHFPRHRTVLHQRRCWQEGRLCHQDWKSGNLYTPDTN